MSSPIWFENGSAVLMGVFGVIEDSLSCVVYVGVVCVLQTSFGCGASSSGTRSVTVRAPLVCLGCFAGLVALLDALACMSWNVDRVPPI